MKYLKYKKKRVGFKTRGRGKKAIVFLHGFSEDSCIWDDFVGDLLEEKHKVIAIDLPGFGKSEVVEGVSMSYMAAIVKAVIDHQKLEQIILIGHSMGGYVSLAFAEKYPDLLYGMGLFHSHGFADTEATKANRQKAIEFIRRQGSALYLKQTIPTYFAPAFAQANPYQLDKLIHKASGYSAEGIIEALKAMKKRPARIEVLKTIAVPVLLIFGKNDIFIAPEKAMEQAQWPEVCFADVLPKVGHMGMFEAPNETQVFIRDFVDFCELKINALEN